MKKFNFIKTSIEGVFIIEPTVFEDDRGYFMEAYHKNEFEENNINIDCVQDNQSKSSKGVLRGLHFQYTQPQGKLVRVLKGKVFDVAVDLRKDSETYGQYESVILSEENKKQFYVPPRFAHGFLVLSDEAEFTYKCTDFYNSEDEGGIIWNDPDIGIDWPLEEENLILSEKDKSWKTLKNTLTDF
ncbi:dTDP-4-dehydrorhamnose 3,5-epimerase [Candidatus Methanobinarius endosymbioticus]|uniref:dTDP-4-dehydrorhamnose 3,5-epimerase n=1 Tax=Candidatus Methanobinarius endosymbioticus TaxID=2006182 RepID=A0A366M9B6_9EURY|nr:dTDP-4-dehydrorhamnose 3,5-epimerase [Candidatus Methanobinarius endosymbioticus]